MWEKFGVILLVIAAFGCVYQCCVFVMKTLPDNYGSNPGFGCFESMIMPWYVCGCIGLALLTHSWQAGLLAWVIGFFSLGLIANLLARLFSKR